MNQADVRTRLAWSARTARSSSAWSAEVSSARTQVAPGGERRVEHVVPACRRRCRPRPAGPGRRDELHRSDRPGRRLCPRRTRCCRRPARRRRRRRPAAAPGWAPWSYRPPSPTAGARPGLTWPIAASNCRLQRQLGAARVVSRPRRAGRRRTRSPAARRPPRRLAFLRLPGSCSSWRVGARTARRLNSAWPLLGGRLPRGYASPVPGRPRRL